MAGSFTTVALLFGTGMVASLAGRARRRQTVEAAPKPTSSALLNTRSPARPRLVRTLTSSPPKISTRSWTPAES